MKIEFYDMLSMPFEKPALLEEPLTPATIEMAIEAYGQMGQYLRKIVENEAGYSSYLTLIDGIRTSVKSHLSGALRPGKVERPYVPLVAKEAVKEWSDRISMRMSAADGVGRRIIVIFAMAAYCYETRVLWTLDADLHNGFSQAFQPNFIAEFASYGFWKTVRSQDNDGFDFFGARRAIEAYTIEQRQFINQAISRHSQSVAEMQGVAAEYRDKLGAIVEQVEERVADVTNRVTAVDEDVGRHKQIIQDGGESVESLFQQISKADEHVQSFAKAVREELKVDTTKKLWNRRAIGSAISFWTSALVIAVAIFFPPYWAFTHIDDVVMFFRHVGDAAVQGLPTDATATQFTAATISRLVIVSAPLAMYFWAIKLIVRFNTRSMMLMDDARQRQTTMDTYFHLVENDKASPEERGLMLNALFKPLPGQGQDSVEPPNFMELVKKE